MIYLVAFVVLVLATARLTRLIYFDDITAKWRLGLKRGSLMEKIAFCPWCASVWASMFTSTVAMAAAWTWWSWNLGTVLTWGLLLIPAVSYPAGWLVHKETVATSRGE